MAIISDIEGLIPHHLGCFVPTMGALHHGHLSLIHAAAAHSDAARPVIVSIFVNPTQFAPGEDFERYPRNLEQDAELAFEAGASLVFAPDVDTIYPPDAEVATPPLPAVAVEPGLEDAHRPGHFEGVCQVVARLFDLVRPAKAFFGEKDYQQLLVIKAMVAESGGRWGDLAIHGQPTVRQRDGLAMSSRNRYLAPADRDRALGLSRALQVAHAAQHPDTAERLMREQLESSDLDIDYAVVRDAQTLTPVTDFTRPARALIAARLGKVRLIDNAPMTIWR